MLSQNISLDGVMQSPGPTDVPFRYRGWAVDFASSPDGAGFDFEQEVGLPELAGAGALLLGRVTFEAMEAFWPTAEGEMAARINALPKYVVTSPLTEAPWDATVLGDDWLGRVADLRDRTTGDVVVYGSRRLCHALFGHDLVDEVRQTVYPLVLGTGDRLFGDTEERIPLRLVEAHVLGGGVVRLVHAAVTRSVSGP